MAESSENFIVKLFSVFFSPDDPEREKKKLLKELAKQLSKSQFKFYKPKTQEAQPNLAKFFHEIYKTVGATQVLLQNADSSGVLKTIVIDNFLDEKALSLKEALTEQGIRERADQLDHKTLATELKDKLVSFFALFDSDKVNSINETYNLLFIFLKFINFDYFFLLKKFDSSIKERDFVYNPKFDTINGDYISDDLKDFLEIMPVVTGDYDWEALFNVLQNYRGTEIISRPAWMKLLKILSSVKKSRILEYIIMHIDSDPYFKPLVFNPHEKIIEEYLNKMKTQTEITVQKIMREKKDRKVDDLAAKVFGTTAVSRMKFYNEKSNVVFAKKMLGGFIYVVQMNYLKAFLIDYLKRDIKEVIDVLLIRGQWATNLLSQQLSESFHQLMRISDDIIKFDENLSEEGQMGLKLKNAVHQADKDKNNIKFLKQYLNETNEKALKLIQEAGQNCVTVGKNLKNAIDDYSATPHELLINWKEIDSATENSIKPKMDEVYKKIYYFVQLLQFLTK